MHSELNTTSINHSLATDPQILSKLSFHDLPPVKLSLAESLSDLKAPSINLRSEEREYEEVTTPPRDAAREIANATESASPFERTRAYIKAPAMWASAFALNVYNIIKIFDMVKIHPMRGGLITEDHPWSTGINPETKKPIWQSNVVFRTTPDRAYPDSDEQIVQKTGKFLARMVSLSASSAKYPEGAPQADEHGVVLRRMPHAINYIHGSAHYNGGWIIFNNFEEAFHYFNNRAFRQEIRRFAREEGREISILFRDKNYDTKEYGYLGGFLRTQFPWYSNTNGPKDMVHWGSRAPYPTVNMITGHFRSDIAALNENGSAANIVREPIKQGEYFQDPYDQKSRSSARFTEKFFSKFIDMRLKLRAKEKGNLFFVDKRELDAIYKRRHDTVVTDEKLGISWPIKAQDFLGKSIHVNDMSAFKDDKGVLPIPSRFDPKRDILIGISPDHTFHTFLVAGGREYHGTLLYRNPAKIREPHDAGMIKAQVYVRLKDLPEETVQTLSKYISSLEGSYSATCTQAVAHALKEGAGLQFQSPPHSSLSLSGFLKALVKDGVIDAHGKKIATEVYSGLSDTTIEQIYHQMRWRDIRFAGVAPVARVYGELKAEFGSKAADKIILD